MAEHAKRNSSGELKKEISVEKIPEGVVPKDGETPSQQYVDFMANRLGPAPVTDAELAKALLEKQQKSFGD